MVGLLLELLLEVVGGKLGVIPLDVKPPTELFMVVINGMEINQTLELLSITEQEVLETSLINLNYKILSYEKIFSFLINARYC
jgi:hypothetical protein